MSAEPSSAEFSTSPPISPLECLEYNEDPNAPGYWFYRGLRIHGYREVHKFVVSFARRHLSPSSEILDLATGDGALAQQLHDVGFHHVSCTSWNQKSRVAVPTYPVDLNQSFSVSNVGRKKYALVCCLETIEHLENPAGFLRNCADLLAHDGYLILSTPNVESSLARLQWLIRGQPLSFSGEEVYRNGHISMMWREGIELLIKLAGFAISEKHLLGQPRFRASLRSVVKRALCWVMERILPGEPAGVVRLYVLARSRPTQQLSSKDVY